MTFQGDPYRTLGIAPGASLNEIRSAYRRLAKQYHPDAAGERALPRFLAIQAAYERLVDGEGRLRAPGTGSRAAAGRAGGGEPWRADPARARA
ncbi:MAG: J domain-containing protein, partial [Chloroflexota bacterium]